MYAIQNEGPNLRKIRGFLLIKIPAGMRKRDFLATAAAVLAAGCLQAAVALSNTGYATHAGECFCSSGRRGITNVALVHGARMQLSGAEDFRPSSPADPPVHGRGTDSSRKIISQRCACDPRLPGPSWSRDEREGHRPLCVI